MVIVPFAVGLFAGTASLAILRLYAAELFPTSFRSTASALAALAYTVGPALSLAFEGKLFALTQSYWSALAIVISGSILAPLIIATVFPETAGLELEAIAPE
jgi:hypothetical protein